MSHVSFFMYISFQLIKIWKKIAKGTMDEKDLFLSYDIYGQLYNIVGKSRTVKSAN